MSVGLLIFLTDILLRQELVHGGVTDDELFVKVGRDHVQSTGSVDGLEELVIDVVRPSEAEAAEADACGTDHLETLVPLHVPLKHFRLEDMVPVVLLHAYSNKIETGVKLDVKIRLELLFHFTYR